MTEQNYGAGNPYANSPTPTGQPSPQPLPAADQRQPAKPLTRHEEVQHLDYLWLNDFITEDQRDWSTITPVPDYSMAPLFSPGGYVIDYLLDPTEYQEKTGRVVAVSTKEGYLIGRLSAINRQTVTLSYENRAIPATRIKRKAIRQVSECIWTFGSPVL